MVSRSIKIWKDFSNHNFLQSEQKTLNTGIQNTNWKL
jgi:hypothetical protein